MIDKKIIKGLECCLPSHDPDCNLCPYDSIDLRCRAKLRDDIMMLLKAQEPVEPKLVDVNTWICGECDALIGWDEFTNSGLELVMNKYCPQCGRKVKWDD